MKYEVDCLVPSTEYGVKICCVMVILTTDFTDYTDYWPFSRAFYPALMSRTQPRSHLLLSSGAPLRRASRVARHPTQRPKGVFLSSLFALRFSLISVVSKVDNSLLRTLYSELLQTALYSVLCTRNYYKQLFTPYSVLGTVDALAHQLLASLDIRILLRFGDGIPEGIPAADADLEVFVLFGMDLRILECLGIKDIHLKSCSATL